MINFVKIGCYPYKKNLFLFHGLYSSPGFFVPYLPYLTARWNIILLNVNYHRLLSSFAQESFLKEHYKNLIIPKPDHVICHSLGSIMPFLLGVDCKSIDLVAPPFFATKNVQRYHEAVMSFRPDFDDTVFSSAFNISQRFQNDSIALGVNFFLPTHDQVFTYHHNSLKRYTEFNGDHFNVFDYFSRLAP